MKKEDLDIIGYNRDIIETDTYKGVTRFRSNKGKVLRYNKDYARYEFLPLCYKEAII